MRALRRVGLRGLIADIRWRLGSVLGERNLGQALRDVVRLARALGVRGMMARARFGVHQLVSPQEMAIPAQPGHPWRSSFAYDAAFDPFFDLSLDELEANRAVTSRFAQRPVDIRSATWFLTYFDNALFGGVHTILRLMAHLKEQHGVENRLVVFDRRDIDDADIRHKIAAAFSTLLDIDIVLPVQGRVPYDELPPSDIAVCTMWISAYALARYNRTRAKFYMVQDYEPAFYSAGTLSALAEATYRLGYAGIVNTPGLEGVYRSYGHPAVSLVPAVDNVGERTEKPSLRGEPVQVVVYGRPSTDRNAFELIASAAVHLKRQYGDAVRIVSAGEEWDPAELGLRGIIENRGLLPSLEAVRRLYDASDIGISLMLSKHPSYQPFEYLASYVAPVSNINAATEWMLRDGDNCLLAEPFPGEIARAVGRLIEDHGLRDRIAESGHCQVTSVSWAVELEKVWNFIVGAERN